MKTIRLFLLTALLSMVTGSALAGNNYYSKVTATATPSGSGKVYVATEAKTPADTDYEDSDEKTQKTSSTTHTYYLHAQATDGYDFVGWFDGESQVSTDNPYTATLENCSDTEATPTTVNYTAKFAAKGAPIIAFAINATYLNITKTYKAEVSVTNATADDLQYSSSNTAVATVAADGTVTAVGQGSTTITAAIGSASASYIVTVLDHSQDGITQIGNGDFEDWSNVTGSNHAPNNWNSFETVEGGLASTAKGVQVARADGRPGSNGYYAADIFSRSVSGIATAQGNLTLGTIIAGAMIPNDAGNHNESHIADPAKSETIAAIPDAMKVWVKFSPITATDQARIAVSVHDAYDYITYGDKSHDNDANKAHALAQAELNFGACDWTEKTLPFSPTGNTTDGQKYIIANFTTNKTPGKGSVGDHLYIDDITLIYNSSLRSATYDGTPLTFNDGAASVDAPYDASLLSLDIDGHSATVDTLYDAATCLLTLTVKGADIAVNPTNQHIYTVQFAAPQSEVTTFHKVLTVCINGQTSATIPADITFTKRSDDTYAFSLRNFGATLGGQYMGVGNITVEGLQYDAATNRYTFKGDITIAAGDDPSVPAWIGPSIGAVPLDMTAQVNTAADLMLATIDIDMQSSLGQIIKVVVAPEIAISKDTQLEANYTDYLGLHNYIYTRTFKAGWNTITLPFDWDAAAFGTGIIDEVREFSGLSADGETLLFAKVDDTSLLRAGVPYLIYLTADTTAPIYFGTTCKATTLVEVQHDAWLFQGNYGIRPVQPEEVGLFYGIVNNGDGTAEFRRAGEGATFKCTVGLFAYLGFYAAPARMKIGFSEATTDGIATANIAREQHIYDLSGRQTKATTRGLYIVGGKKIIK